MVDVIRRDDTIYLEIIPTDDEPSSSFHEKAMYWGYLICCIFLVLCTYVIIVLDLRRLALAQMKAVSFVQWLGRN